jgi:pilin isopeptide linkage protein/LPXTG-motif cell wall-anchored protein
VTVTLLADGDDVTQEGITATVELNEKNNWKYTWEGLNKRAAGQEISYTVEEAPIDNYEAEITGDAKDGYTIKNFHLADPVPVMSDPPVKKVVKGNPATLETFTFQMKALTEGAPMPEGAKDGVMTMNIVGSGEKEFGIAEITKAGTYEYEITEVNTKAANYTYDTTVYKLTVEVKEEADGTQVKLVKTETVTGGNGTIVFTNTYEEPPAKTGDTTVIVPYIVIGLASIALLLMILFRRRRAN